MRIGFISDLHIDSNLHVDFLPLLVQLCEEEQLHTLVIAGDTASNDQSSLHFTKALQQATGTRVLMLPGNHEQYVLRNSGYRYADERIPAEAMRREKLLLDDPQFSLAKNPIRAGDWAVVGTTGWYDYSFDKKKLTARRLQRLANMRFWGVAWPEMHYVNGNLPNAQRDVARTNASLAYLRTCFEQIRSQPGGAQVNICAVTHMAPTVALCSKAGSPGFRSFVPYLGSERYRTLFEEYGVAISVSGHTHIRADKTLDGTRYVNVSLGNYFSWKHKDDPLREMRDTLFVLEVDA